MVVWVDDRTGRFPKRPHYKPAELDRECETVVGRFLRGRYGVVNYPLSTEDLTLLVESVCSDVDHYADLTAEGTDVEGMTLFLPDAAPAVFISATIASDEHRENRRRTTLAHELGHVHFHASLFAERFLTSNLLERPGAQSRMICKRDNILNAREVDWMEWQAGYASGAFLMPASALRRRVGEFCATRGLLAAIHTESGDAREVEQIAMEGFQVSRDAARVRLLQLGCLTTERQAPSLFA
jgi:Zn-dependent peptidase ImmA (M78 family)